jgi:hypothetical protein
MTPTLTVRQAPPVAAELAAGLDRVSVSDDPDVEILTVGMNWDAATGDVTYTLEHLADAVLAANDDPHILSPRLRIGHFDPRFNEEPHTWDPFAYHGELRADGNPVFGKVANLGSSTTAPSSSATTSRCPTGSPTPPRPRSRHAARRTPGTSRRPRREDAGRQAVLVCDHVGRAARRGDARDHRPRRPRPSSHRRPGRCHRARPTGRDVNLKENRHARTGRGDGVRRRSRRELLERPRTRRHDVVVVPRAVARRRPGHRRRRRGSPLPRPVHHRRRRQRQLVGAGAGRPRLPRPAGRGVGCPPAPSPTAST